MSPSATAWSTSVDRSNVLNVIWPTLFACCRACRTGVEAVGPSVRIPSMSGSDDSLFPIVWVMPPGSFRSTGTTSASNPSPSLKPLHRRSSPTLPTSWFTQIAWVTPASFIRSPASCPATSSFCPMCARTPRSENTSLPELIEITGIPASTAFLIDGPSASASGMLTIRPSGFEATAPSIRWLMATMSKVPGARYSAVTASSAAAALTPLATTDQNGSEAWPWVTTTIRNPVWLTAPDCPGDSSSFPPPVHAAPKRASTSRTPAHFRRIIPPPFLRGNASSRVPLRHRHTGHGRFSGPHAESLEELEALGDVLDRAHPRLGCPLQHRVLLQHVPAIVVGRLEGRDDGGDVHVARSERPVHPCRDGVPVSHPSRPH